MDLSLHYFVHTIFNIYVYVLYTYIYPSFFFYDENAKATARFENISTWQI